MLLSSPRQLEWIIFLELILLFVCNSIQLTKSNDVVEESSNQREFVHLLHLAAKSKRLHLVSEISRNGHKLQLEEFLDLNSWSQLLQFKWHEDGRHHDTREIDDEEKDGSRQALRTHKINFLVLNDEKRRSIVQYEPFSCYTQIHESSADQNMLNEIDWWELVSDSLRYKSDDPSINPRMRHTETLESLMSVATQSPYLAQVPRSTSDAIDAWVFGLSGLWLKAEFTGETLSSLAANSTDWQLQLPKSQATLVYQFHQDQSKLGSQVFRSVGLLKNDRLIDRISLIDAEFEIDSQLLANLFKLPIGFNCPPTISSLLLSKDRLVFETPDSRATLQELELVATRFRFKPKDSDKTIDAATEVKTISIARSKHPMNQAATLSLFRFHEDQLKIIRDYHNRLQYNISTDGSNECQISGLHIYDFNHRQSTEHLEVKLSNGIIMNLNEVFLEFVLEPKGEFHDEMHLLNVIRVDSKREELVFESQVPNSYTELLALDSSKPEEVGRKISIVRVYERSLPTANSNFYLKPLNRLKMGPLRLSRVLLLVFDQSRRNKLAEVRFNVLSTDFPLSFKRRAQLFDLSQCFAASDESMLLKVFYFTEPKLIDYAETRSDELIEAFYLSSFDWWMPDNSSNLVDGTGNRTGDAMTESEKKRIGSSLNFLRLPRVELRSSPQIGGLELRVHVLDKPSPIYLFDQLLDSSFVSSNSIDERLMVSDAKECSKFCQLHSCRMFAFDESSLECRLSPVTLDEADEASDEEEDAQAQSEGDGESLTLYKMVNSTLYMAPARGDKIDSQAPLSSDEASLAELHSYLEHTLYHLDFGYDEDDKVDDLDDEQQPTSGQSNKVMDNPLFSFRFADRSASKSEYSPPQRRLMTPDQVVGLRVPPSLDPQADDQRTKAAAAFRSQYLGRVYQLNLMDEGELPGLGLSQEDRTFINRKEGVYYSLRKLQSLDMDSCVTMCFNIEEWDAATGGEQICSSFSHCPSRKECSLLIRTDFNFTGSITELVDEGDIVLDVNSTYELTAPEEGCTVSRRNCLAKFEGPIKLPQGSIYGLNNSNAPQDLQSWDPEMDKALAEKHEWLAAFSIESSVIYENTLDDCAAECDRRNKLGQLCVSFDFCIIKKPPRVEQKKHTIHYESRCELLLVNSDENRSKLVEQARNLLVRSISGARKRANTTIDKGGLEPTCNRYLVSHLSEFNHVKQHKLSTHFTGKLERPTPPMDNLNLDQCALECATRRLNCLAFEYCTKYSKEFRVMTRNCTLYGYPKLGLNETILESEFNIELNSNKLSSYDRDCHVYLRGDIKSLEELFGAKSVPSKLVTAEFEHMNLLLAFIIFYLIAAMAVIIYSKYQRPNRHRRLF